MAKEYDTRTLRHVSLRLRKEATRLDRLANDSGTTPANRDLLRSRRRELDSWADTFLHDAQKLEAKGPTR